MKTIAKAQTQLKKFLFGFSSFALMASLFFLQVGISSCTKEKIIKDTVIIKDIVILKDTVIIKDTLLSTQILTANPWKIKETRGVLGGATVYYVRGGSANTESFDNEFILFNANGTGSYVGNNGTQFQLTWNFMDAEHVKIMWSLLNSPATYTLTWDNIRYKNNSLIFDQYYTDGNTGKISHSQNIRIPK